MASSSKKKKRRKLTARNADPQELYQKSVQDPDHEVRLFRRVYKKKNGTRPHVMREDFCGSALLCARWVEAHKENVAIGVDLHAPTLDWGREHNLIRLTEDEASRVTLINDNVLHVDQPAVDVLCALNFSYYVFQTRKDLLSYFEVVRRSLAPGGIFVADCFGGPDAYREQEEKRNYKGYTYVWRQQHFDPITHHALYHIDFRFPGGSRIRPAYTYDWRLWTIPEIRELMHEAGFETTEVYWEGTDKDSGEGNGIYRKVTTAPADDAWVSYVIGS